MESKNIKQFIGLVLFVALISYVFLFKLSTIADAEIISEENELKIKLKEAVNTFELKSPIEVFDNKLLVFVSAQTGLNYSESQFIIDKCNNNDVELFLILGLIKKESDFNPDSTGNSGEIGLGQLMERTARHYSYQLGYEYNKEDTYEPKRNIDLAVEHISYLKQLYENDEHKVLTAYNRGTKGLENYIRDKKSPFEVSSMSSYSVDVLKYRDEFKKEFEKYVSK
jgi:soluble lytic murein transglycosylase-like protein